MKNKERDLEIRDGISRRVKLVYDNYVPKKMTKDGFCKLFQVESSTLDAYLGYKETPSISIHFITLLARASDYDLRWIIEGLPWKPLKKDNV